MQLGVQGEAVGDGGAEVGKILHNLKGVVVDGDGLLTSWSMILVFLRSIVRPNSPHLYAKRLINRCKASSV